MRRRIVRLVAIIFGGAAAAGGGSCLAGTVYWDGGTDANWYTKANWSSGAVPTGSDDVVLNEAPYGSPYTVIANVAYAHSITTDTTSSLYDENSLSLSAPSQFNSGLTLPDYSSLSSTSTVTLGGTTNLYGGSISASTLYIDSGTSPNTAQLNIVIDNPNSFDGPSLNAASVENDGSVTLSTSSNITSSQFPTPVGSSYPSLPVGSTFDNRGTFTASSNIYLYIFWEHVQ